MALAAAPKAKARPIKARVVHRTTRSNCEPRGAVHLQCRSRAKMTAVNSKRVYHPAAPDFREHRPFVDHDRAARSSSAMSSFTIFHHGLERLRMFHQVGQARRHDLPGQSELILQPAA